MKNRVRGNAVRSALGADAGMLARNVTGGVLAAVIFGSGIGLAVMLELQPLIKKWLGPGTGWEVEPIAVASVLLALAAAAGCYFPARSAIALTPPMCCGRGEEGGRG